MIIQWIISKKINQMIISVKNHKIINNLIIKNKNQRRVMDIEIVTNFIYQKNDLDNYI
jgi:hypothetical protein